MANTERLVWMFCPVILISSFLWSMWITSYLYFVINKGVWWIGPFHTSFPQCHALCLAILNFCHSACIPHEIIVSAALHESVLSLRSDRLVCSCCSCEYSSLSNCRLTETRSSAPPTLGIQTCKLACCNLLGEPELELIICNERKLSHEHLHRFFSFSLCVGWDLEL